MALPRPTQGGTRNGVSSSLFFQGSSSSGRRGRPSLAGLVEPTVAALNPGRGSPSRTAASNTKPWRHLPATCSTSERVGGLWQGLQPAAEGLEGGESRRERHRGDFTGTSQPRPPKHWQRPSAVRFEGAMEGWAGTSLSPASDQGVSSAKGTSREGDD